MSDVSEIFKSKGYVPYISQDFYSCNTFIEKQGRNSVHINSNVNGKNSGWPNAAHIILPYFSKNIDVIKEANEGNLLSYLKSKFNEKRASTFIYQPTSQPSFYQRFKIFSESGTCHIEKDGNAKNLMDLIPDIKKDGIVHDIGNENISMSQSNSLDVPPSPTTDLFASDSTHKPSQIIYYGVPGCGKSNKIGETLKDVPDSNKIRTVFHPEYTNADFIGQILPQPKMQPDGKTTIAYEFTPGPFTEILQRANQTSTEHFYLVIEEINRGNAAAIFGEVFQLLDRTDSGESQYPVRKKELCEYLQKDEIRLPGNLSIIATMNTSDQNVFTLDNAFQRRFDMVLVRSGVTRNPDADKTESKYTFDSEDIEKQFYARIEGTDDLWGNFWDWINFKIPDKLQGIASTEDKRLGLWFVKNVEAKNDDGTISRKIPRKVFAEKVLKYLWDDVFKFKRREIFLESIHSLEELISAAEDSTDENILSRIFKEYPQNNAD